MYVVFGIFMWSVTFGNILSEKPVLLLNVQNVPHTNLNIAIIIIIIIIIIITIIIIIIVVVTIIIFASLTVSLRNLNW